jgi:hypothetical protein
LIDEKIEICGQSLAPLPFEKSSFTLWLVRGKVIFHILMDWEELKVYFTSDELAQSQFISLLINWPNHSLYHF